MTAAAVAVVELGRSGVQRDLHRHPCRVEALERSPARAARQQHRVGEDRHRDPARGGVDDLGEVRGEERLAAGREDLTAAEAGETRRATSAGSRRAGARGVDCEQQ